jgi:hypothetical protein
MNIQMTGVDEYVPPTAFDPNIRVEPPEPTPTQESRKLQSHYCKNIINGNH